MEASGGAQYWARQLTALGHEVRLMSPALMMPYRKGNKTDRNDADAILRTRSFALRALLNRGWRAGAQNCVCAKTDVGT
jgi:transposase